MAPQAPLIAPPITRSDTKTERETGRKAQLSNIEAAKVCRSGDHAIPYTSHANVYSAV